MKNIKAVAFNDKTIPLNNVRAYLFESLFVILAVALPSICHLLGAPIRYILPMHWTVILAGLVYGWKGGATAGFLSPAVSFLITGMPYLSLIPMTAELFTYGALTGLLKEKFKMNSFLSITIALIAGRIVFLLGFASLNTGIDLSVYVLYAIAPGLFVGVLQIILLPFIAKFWTK